MSLIAPITPTSPPKPVLLGSTQGSHNGKVNYRVGIPVNLTSGPLRFADMFDFMGTPLFGGSLPVDTHHEHQHLFGTSKDGTGRLHVFHAVVENAHGGQVVFDIAALSGTTAAVHQVGYAYDTGGFFSPAGEPIPLTSLDPNTDTWVRLVDFAGEQKLFNLGQIHELAIEIGTVPMKGEKWEARRDGDAIRFYPLHPERGANTPHSDLEHNPYEPQPARTLEAFGPAFHFHNSLAPAFLSRSVSSGYVAPVLTTSSSREGGFAR